MRRAAVSPGRDAQVAGVEAAIWAETISGFDDLSFLLPPRLPGVAHQAWSGPHLAGWAGHRDRLARHGRLWTHDDLTYFRASTVDWRCDQFTFRWSRAHRLPRRFVQGSPSTRPQNE